VLEAIVGFDVALLVRNSVFWSLRGFSSWPSGAVIMASWWTGLHRLAEPDRTPPPYRLNLFLQYTRPEYLRGARAGEWSDWKRPYFRFRIAPLQQRALDACAGALGANGLVAYASPAFHSRADYFRHIENRTMVANTHFAASQHLAGHTRYTYVDAIKLGKAHSVVTEVAPIRFGSGGDGVGDPPEKPGGGDDRGPGALLAAARRAATAAVAASPQLVGGKPLFDAAVQRAIDLIRSLSPLIVEADEVLEGPLSDFVVAAVFSSMARVGWTLR
jgi:hypothetical protein